LMSWACLNVTLTRPQWRHLGGSHNLLGADENSWILS
jgi:hypothetical protein